MKIKNILILATGGTIAGSVKTQNGSYNAGLLDINSLINSMPKINKNIKLHAKQIFNIPSQNIKFADMLNLAFKLQEQINSYDGVVITHGTDTLEESSYMINLLIKSKKPIVFTASMRTSDMQGSDAFTNLHDSIILAASKKARKMGVLVCLNEEIHLSREINKAHTSALNAFLSPNTGKIGMICHKQIQIYTKSTRKHSYKSRFSLSCMEKNIPKIGIIYSYADMDEKLVDFYMQEDFKGIIFAGLGNANIPENILSSLLKAQKMGMIVVKCSRSLAGYISASEESKEEKAFIKADDLNPQKARILLAICLAHNLNLKQIKKAFKRY